METAATPANAAKTAAAIDRLNLSVEQQMSLTLQPLQERAIKSYAKFVSTSGNARPLLLEYAELLESIARPKEEGRSRHAAAELRRQWGRLDVKYGDIYRVGRSGTGRRSASLEACGSS